ncbi:MAG: TonB-dependent receptor [Acidobacteria bacterium]|nr:MAG: TonB-dependent receptor [Acidobacteriota bacterium]
MVLLAAAAMLSAQRGGGELHLTVLDTSGAGVEASGQLVNQAIHLKQKFSTDKQGRYIARNLPFGVYRLELERPGFGTHSALIAIRSELPLEYTVPLSLAPVETSVEVKDSATLLDAQRAALVFFVGHEAIQERPGSGPGRELTDLVQMQPGWLVEANGVLHPRGAEYNTQYVIDGFPIVDNRSPAFAPSLNIDEFVSMNVRASGYPAEYGRKLGGVIEITSDENMQPGWHGAAVFEGGSYSTANGFLTSQYSRGSLLAGINLESAYTERYLDPPSQQNDTNKATTGGGTARFGADLSERDRLRVTMAHRRAGFLVPDERLQFQVGQREDRTNQETSGQVSYQRTISSRLLVNARAMVRDLAASLWSNTLSVPILADQGRGVREGYFSGVVSAHRGGHEIKAGGEAIRTSVHENFDYRITDAAFFPADVPPQLHFLDSRRGLESAAFAQDMIQAGRWSISAGIRRDTYRLLVRESAWSPRLSVAWSWPLAGLVLRASYDRVFEIPAIENLLLASSAAAQRLTETATGLPVPPAHGNYLEAGFAKTLFGRARLTGSYYQRRIRNFSDDDLLLNTGVTFPISFASAAIHGIEGQMEIPRWGPFSGFISWANMSGTGRFPVTGGLFLEENAAELLRSNNRFRITQDQRNTARARLRTALGSRLWAAVGAWYGSGLPIELEDNVDTGELARRYGPEVLSRVNFARSRLRPSYSLDASLGFQLWRRDQHEFSLQADVLNVTDRLNVINFASLFSGTAIGAPRTYSLRLRGNF